MTAKDVVKPLAELLDVAEALRGHLAAAADTPVMLTAKMLCDVDKTKARLERHLAALQAHQRDREDKRRGR